MLPISSNSRSLNISNSSGLLDPLSSERDTEQAITVQVAPLIEAPVSLRDMQGSVMPKAKHHAYLGMAQELDHTGVLVDYQQGVSSFAAKTLASVAKRVAGLELGACRAFAAVRPQQGGAVLPDQKAGVLAEALSKRIEGLDVPLLQRKLNALLGCAPDLERVIENALMGRITSLVWSPLVSKPSVQSVLEGVDQLYSEFGHLTQQRASFGDVSKAMSASVKALQAKGSLTGGLAGKIQSNPSKQPKPLPTTVAKWLADGKPLNFSETIVFGEVNPDAMKKAHQKQPLFDVLLRASGVDRSSCAPNTPVVIKIRGEDEAFDEEVLSKFRELLVVTQPVSVVRPGSPDQAYEVDLKQAPLTPTLEHLLCGRYDKVSPDVLSLIDKAPLFKVKCSSNPEFELALKEALAEANTESLQTLKRSLVARLLLPALCLEGTSLMETARNLALPTALGIGLDVGKNYIPNKMAWLKTLVMQLFFLGVDAADNMAGAWPEVQSLLETLGIENVDYKSIFNEDEPKSNAQKAKEYMKLAVGLRSATGEAGPAVATALRSVTIGTVLGNALTAGYTTAIGALDLNPALRVPFGMLAIVGTSLGIALNFSVNHADLSLAFKKQIHDGTLKLPDDVRADNAKALNAHCSRLAKRQLMLLSGTGPAAEAFTFAPLAAISNLLGYAVPMKVVEAVITPLMPGMENLVRLVAMSKHSNSIEASLHKFDEKLLGLAAEGQRAVISESDYDRAMYGLTGECTADFTLAMGGLLMGLLGRRGYHSLQVVGSTDHSEAVIQEGSEAFARLGQVAGQGDMADRESGWATR